MDRRASNASQDTFISLQQLDPSPIESPSTEDVPDLPAPPPPQRSKTSSVLGLSGSSPGHSSIYYLTRLQKYSSYAFTLFASLHLTNTSLIPLITRSVSKSDQYLLLTRPYYQSIPLEPLLITLPLTTHILSGFILRLRRRNATLARTGASDLTVSTRLAQRVKVWPPLSWTSLSGYLLTPLVVGHAIFNRLIPWIYEGGSSSVGLGFVSHGFAKHPVLSRMGYLALVCTAAGHMVWGAAKWNDFTPRGNEKQRKRRWWVINGTAVIFACLWMAGGFGIVARGGKADGWIGNGYDVLYSKIPFMNL